MELEGKNVIYIGGFGGIECNIFIYSKVFGIEAFLKSSVKSLLIFDLKTNGEYLEILKNKYNKSYVDFIFVDLTKRESIEGAYKEAADKIGSFDIVVNGSGVVNEHNPELTVAVNLTGLMRSTLTAMEYMSKVKGGLGGCIVNISSVAGLDPSEVCCIYSATKCGVTAFTRAFANPVYFDKTGISFITICPGATATPMAEDMDSKLMMRQYNPKVADMLANIHFQTAEELANKFINILKMAKNGSTWVIEDGAFQEIKFTDIWHPIIQ